MNMAETQYSDNKHALARRAAVSDGTQAKWTIQDYEIIFDGLIVSVNLLLFAIVIIRQRLRQDSLYWLVLALFFNGALQGIVYGIIWAAKRPDGSWKLGLSGCLATDYTWDFLRLSWYMIMTCLEIHLMIQLWSTEDQYNLKKSKTYVRVSVILLMVSLVLGGSLGVSATMLKGVRLEENWYTGNVHCRYAGPHRAIASYIRRAADCLPAVLGIFMLILAKIAYRTAKKFLGTILAAFLMSVVIAIIENLQLIISWSNMSVGAQIFVMFAQHSLPGWVVLFWLSDSGIFQSVCCCRQAAPDEPAVAIQEEPTSDTQELSELSDDEHETIALC